MQGFIFANLKKKNLKYQLCYPSRSASDVSVFFSEWSFKVKKTYICNGWSVSLEAINSPASTTVCCWKTVLSDENTKDDSRRNYSTRLTIYKDTKIKTLFVYSGLSIYKFKSINIEINHIFFWLTPVCPPYL